MPSKVQGFIKIDRRWTYGWDDANRVTVFKVWDGSFNESFSIPAKVSATTAKRILQGYYAGFEYGFAAGKQDVRDQLKKVLGSQ